MSRKTRSARTFGSILILLATVSQSSAQDPESLPAPKQVLLLVNGQVLKGEVQEVDDGYVVRHKVGVIHKRRRDVQGAFESLDTAYLHLKERTPENDPDERLKLALWCLSQNLKEQARAELKAVTELSPENTRAQAMLASLDLRNANKPALDQDVLRTSGQEIDTPAELRGVESLRSQYARARNLGSPDIFGLPPALAIKRYQEFARTVHPELQRYCAKCHNEDFQGEFRMVAARSRRDLLDDMVLRANLDATLRLIDPDAPNRSPLLTAAGMTHGKEGKPILNGPNHPSFRVLSAWASSLKLEAAHLPSATPSTAVRPNMGSLPTGDRAESTVEDSFGTGRGTSVSVEPPETRPAIPPPQVVGGSRGSIQGQAPDIPENLQFPTSPLTDPEMQRARISVEPRTHSDTRTERTTLPGQTAPDQSTLAPANRKAPSSSKSPDSDLPPGMFRLPSGEIVPMVTREMTLEDAPPASPSKKPLEPALEETTKKPSLTPPPTQAKSSAPSNDDSAKTKSKNRILNTQAIEGFLKGRTR
jgi:hypothetical protein